MNRAVLAAVIQLDHPVHLQIRKRGSRVPCQAILGNGIFGRNAALFSPVNQRVPLDRSVHGAVSFLQEENG